MPDPGLAGIHASSSRYSNEEARRWATVALLCAAFIIAYLDRQNLSIALGAREFKNFFGLSDNARGLLNSALFLDLCCSPDSGGLVRRSLWRQRPFAIALAL